MASFTFNVPNADLLDFLASEGVATGAEFKQKLIKEKRQQVREYRDKIKMQSITPSLEPDIT